MIDYEVARSAADLIYHQYNDVLYSGAHFHSSFEFIYVFAGAQRVHVNKKDFLLTEGQAILILPNEVHWYEKTPDSESYLCIFSGMYVPELAKQVKNMQLKSSVFPFEFPNLIARFAKEEDPFYIRGFLNIVAACALREGVQKSTSYENDNLIYRIMQYINENYKNDITLKNIAVELGYNYSYLSNLFNTAFPNSFVKVINEYRVNHAKEMLSNSRVSITTISAECGFPSIRTFNRVFKSSENLSPREYRLKFSRR